MASHRHPRPGASGTLPRHSVRRVAAQGCRPPLGALPHSRSTGRDSHHLPSFQVVSQRCCERSAPLLDPFCGSGVIPIEAAMLAAGAAPGAQRTFAFMNFPGFNADTWTDLTRQAASAITTPEGPILGSDRDAGAIKVAIENAERAGVAQWIQFSLAAISAIQPPAGPGWVVTHPPYGVRISTGNDFRAP